MPKPSPEKIKYLLNRGKINKDAAIELLISYIENSKKENERVISIEILSNFSLKDERHYRFLEGLLISDSNIDIQCYAARIIIINFLEKGLDSIYWLIKQNIPPSLIALILNKLLEVKEELVRSIILEELKGISNGKVVVEKKEFESHYEALNIDYTQTLREIVIEELNTRILVEIFLNYWVLKFIGFYYNLFNNLGWKLEKGYVSRLKITGYSGWKRISDIKGLSYLSKLEELIINSCSIEEIDLIDRFTGLKLLILSDNLIVKIKNLENQRKLEYLSLLDNRIEEIIGLDKLTNLKLLDLSYNKITEIKNLNSLHNLNELLLMENNIKEIRSLDNLQNLENLHLSGNQIARISGLRGLKNLRKIYLNKNKITKIHGLEQQIQLKALNLSDKKRNQYLSLFQSQTSISPRIMDF